MDTAEQITTEQEPPITPAPDCQNWLALHDMGFSLIPLKAAGKVPYIAWQAHQKRRAPRSKIEAWYKATPNANIGIVTGAISELVVLDLDSADAITEAERRGLPDTLTVRTGKGRHVYFRHPGHSVNNRAGFLPGMDIRGDGGYIVAPGSIHPSGAVYAWENPPGQFEIADMPEWLLEALEGAGKAAEPAPPVPMHRAPIKRQTDSGNNNWATAALNSELRELASSPEGQRNHRLNIAALKLGQIVAGGRLDAQMVTEQLGAVARTIGLDPAEIEPTIASGMKKGLTQPRRSSRDVVNLNDLENYTGGSKPSEDVIASCFTAINRDTLKFCHSAGKWYQWTRVYWQRNEVKLAHHYARLIARKLSDGDPKVSKASVANGAESFARAHPAHAVTAEFWDKDPFLLGTPDGTVDLRTGTLRPPAQADGITKLTGCSPAPGEPTLWLRFLHEATGGDESMIRYLQQACGYMLTGDTREHALFFVYGPGGNGKSVFLNTASAILGDYATTAGMDTFTASKSDRHPTDLAMLKGARLVSASETEEGRAWAEARIKQLTGGDRISARFMRQDFFEFTPQFKLLIVGNHAPVLANVDDAARRRFNIIPFTFKPEHPDRQLEQKLKAEWPQILQWMIDGCLDWQTNGLSRPEIVRAATEDYFNEQDFLGQWLSERCRVELGSGGLFETASKLYNDWQAYATSHGETAGTSKQFGSKLAKRGLRAKPMRAEGQVQKVYQGIELKPRTGGPIF